MRHLLLSLIFIASLLQSFGQHRYEWQKDRKRFSLSEKETGMNEYILKYHREYDYNWEDRQLILYLTEHRITRVVNPEAIQRHNRIYISLRNVSSVVTVKARSINKEGKVVYFDQNNLKEVKDEDTDNTYKIFAIEGIEPDSEVEYFYTLKVNRRLYETAYFQFEMPMKEASLALSCPKELSFEFKTYNDTTKARLDTANKRKNYSVHFQNVPGLAKEKFSYFDASRKRVELKLAYNYTNSSSRLNTWADAAKTYYKSLVKIDESTEKMVDKFSKTLNDNKDWPTEKRIKNIEDQIKNSIKIETSSGTYHEIPEILKYKQASVQGITSLFSVLFSKFDIPFNIVLTCNREHAKFDGSFDSWSFLDDFLLYFPTTRGFLSPNENALEYPLVPAHFTANKGLFIEPVKIGNFRSAIGTIREIPALPYTFDKDDLTINVKFDSELETNTVTQSRVFVGSDAAYLSTYYGLMTNEQKVKFIKELFNSSVPDINIIKWSATPGVVDLLPRFQVDVTFTSSHFIEKAGNKVLFKVGELIGPQSELYRDDNRMTEVENTNNRGYDRVITVEFPSGYKIGNANGLAMHVDYKDGDNVPFLFESTYTKGDNKVVINITEFYKEVYAPLSRYEDFRKVINASADFNKVTLVLEKN